MSRRSVGVLALQGDFSKHISMVESIGVRGIEIRKINELDAVDALIIPGGESTTLLKFFEREPWMERLSEFGASRSVFGTCAGSILMAEAVENPVQPSLGLIPVTVRRNAYGRQAESFTTDLTDHDLKGGPLPAVFIRAPRFIDVSSDIEVLARYKGEPVLIRHGKHLAAAFHPELTADPRTHRLFLKE